MIHTLNHQDRDLKKSLIAKIEINTETKSRNTKEKWNNQLKIVPGLIEISLNDNLSSRDRG